MEDYKGLSDEWKATRAPLSRLDGQRKKPKDTKTNSSLAPYQDEAALTFPDIT
jgi:hypothetical protein